jgi:hypothetical protein
MKKIFFIFLFFYFTSEIFAISVYPGQIDFEVYENQMGCKNITFVSGGEIIIKDRWSKKNSMEKDINLHSLKKESLGLILDYSKNFLISEKGKTEICFQGRKGSYHGVLLIREKDSNEGVGVWINAIVIKNSTKIGSFSITGSSILNQKGETNIKKYLFVSSFLLSIFLILFLFLLRKKFYFSRTKTSLPTI